MQSLLQLLKVTYKPSKKASLAFIIFGLLILTNCGKRKPPLPPTEIIPQRVVISGFQRGNNIYVNWVMPSRNASESSVLNISRADIYRLIEPTNSSQNLSEEDFASRSTLISTIPISEDDFLRKQLTYIDKLSFAGQAARIRYAIRFANSNGQKAGFSNFLLIDPTAKISEAPNDLNSKVTQDFIEIDWNSPTRNIDGSTPANILGFNIYRTDETKTTKLLNSSPVTNNLFSDKSFEFDKSYTYLIRTVSLGVNGEPVESNDSESINVLPRDIFPPSAPTALTIAASPNTISIFFASNPEKDLAGYRIYRTENPNLPKSEWQLLNQQLLTINTFQDTNVESGKTYYYYVKAVDKVGNSSEDSDVVSDTLP